MSTSTIDCAVIGAGVIGIACARELALAGREVLILESASSFGSGISSRSSEVIHAGLYYPPGSLKARLCVRGRELLYDFCERHGVAHRRCGKLIVATRPAQPAEIDRILANARACGVDDLERLDAAAVRALEPELTTHGGLLSPSTGIVDSHALMLALLGEAERAGATLVRRSPVLGGRAVAGGIELDIGGAEPTRIRAREVVNAAGLDAVGLASRIAGPRAHSLPPMRFAKGSYFVLQGRAPFSRLVYPLPEPGGLGVHLTLDLAGQARFGPDVEWVGEPDYRVEAARAGRFAEAVHTYWPGLPADALQPGYAGVRPKLHGPGEAAADFRIDDARAHGLAGLVNLFGIESPGLTSSLAIAEEVRQRLD